MKIFTIIVNRANYARLFPLLDEIENDKNVENYLILTGTCIEKEYGNFEDLEELTRFKILARLKVEDGNRSLGSMARTTANALRSFSSFLETHTPDMVIIIGDRYEALGYAIAANYFNIKIAHIQGGELSGSVDENIRHCITKLSHLHFASTERSKNIIIQMGENPNRVFNFGCPSGDYILHRSDTQKLNIRKKLQEKLNVDVGEPFLLISYHPTTTDICSEYQNIKTLIKVVKACKTNFIWTLPNSDAGSAIILEEVKSAKELKNLQKCDLISNVSPNEYIELIDCSLICLGNSSSFIRDASFMGTPVILVGNRQARRETSKNVYHSEFTYTKLMTAILEQMQTKKFKPDNLYGNGNASRKILEQLKAFNGSHIKEFNIQ